MDELLPEIRQAIEAGAGRPELGSVPLPATRASYEAAPKLPRPDGIEAPGPRGSLRLRVYRPRSQRERLPAVVFMHGGGWVLCSLDTHDSIAASLASASNCVWISVDYGLAPEARFPAGLHDCLAAIEWAAANSDELRTRPGPLGIDGDSAGGNLAAVASLIARDRGAPPIAFQLLIYPVVDLDYDRASYRENAAYGINAQRLQWYAGQYLADPQAACDWRVAPLLASGFRGLPRTHILAAQFDALRDSNIEFARRLHDAGVDVTLEIEQGVNHGYLNIPITRAADSLARLGRIVGEALSAPVGRADRDSHARP
jgi:acetyl esterase